MILKKFNDNLARWLEILKEIEESSEFLDVDIKDIEHPT